MEEKALVLKPMTEKLSILTAKTNARAIRISADVLIARSVIAYKRIQKKWLREY
jgi:hypothetical protein